MIDKSVNSRPLILHMQKVAGISGSEAHLLSLLPRLMHEIVRIEKRSRSLNYGSNKVRYILPVPAGARVRLGVTLQAVDAAAGGRRFTFSTALEMEGAEKPAMVAEVVTVSYD